MFQFSSCCYIFTPFISRHLSVTRWMFPPLCPLFIPCQAVHALMSLYAQLHLEQQPSVLCFFSYWEASGWTRIEAVTPFGWLSWFGETRCWRSRAKGPSLSGKQRGERSVAMAAAAHGDRSPLLSCVLAWQLCFACWARWKGRQSCAIKHFICLH